MTDNFRAFLKEVSTETTWLEELNAWQTKEEAVAFALEKAAALGIELTAEDFEPGPDELSEDELAAVAGGGQCVCVGAGGGCEDPMDCKATHNGAADLVCACVLSGAGSGERKIYEKALGAYLTPGKGVRCGCISFGLGDPMAPYE